MESKKTNETGAEDNTSTNIMTNDTKKDPDNYEYKISIGRIEDDQVCILCEEVDGNDGFGVWLPVDEVEKMTPEQLMEIIQPEVERRIELLKEIKKKQEENKKKEDKLKHLKERELKIKPKMKKIW